MGLRPKHFFWSMTAMAALMIYGELRDRALPEDQFATEQASSSQDGSGLYPNLNEMDGIKGRKKKAGETETKPPPRTMVIDGKLYVLIDDRWYPKADDNIYWVKGEKIYFVDNQRTEEHLAPTPKQRGGGARDKSADLINSVSDNPFAVQSPANIKKMMDTLTEAKARMQERDKALKALSTAE